MKRIHKSYVLAAAFVLAIISICFLFVWWDFAKSPLITVDKEPTNFVFAEGSSLKKMANQLHVQGVMKNPTIFTLFARLIGAERSLKAGEYRIEKDTTAAKLLRKMIKGDAIQHGFTLVEGWTFYQMIAALNNNPYLKHTLQKENPAVIMEKIGHPGELPEGRFAPDTYLFSGDVTDVKILTDAYRLAQKRLQTAWANKAQDLLYPCPYEALIVASLIEKETAVKEEKNIIAGVILRRLAKDMLLQIDPSVIYGLNKKFDLGKLSKGDYLKDTSYNTYLRKGLPPTPICMPGVESIDAALHPAAGSVLYYVAKGDGTHQFSNTYREQELAIKKYLRRK